MSRGKVLVVDDDRVTAELLAAVLERKGYAVRSVGDGLTASRAVAEDRPDLILLDLMLPDLDGWELCAMIRTLPERDISTTPIIMLSSRSAREDKLRGLRLGADAYVTKPFDPEEIVLRVEALVSARRARMADRSEREEAGGGLFGRASATLYHELKNHLIAISGFARRIESHGDSISAEQLARYAGFIRKSSEHLSSIVENFLLAQKIASEELHLQPEAVRLEETAGELLPLFETVADDKGVRLSFQREGDLRPVRFNGYAARICLSNLLEHAIRCSRNGERVTIRLREAPTGMVVLEVAHGPSGMHLRDAGEVFEESCQARFPKGAAEDIDLGLRLVKALADSLGATVSQKRRSGGSIRFRMEFPVEPETQP